MSDTFDNFRRQKGKAIEIMEKLQNFLSQGMELGVNIHPSLKKKLEDGLDELHHGKLRIALIGGFSEGKTSIAAAWLERLDDLSMNISQQESSNEVKVYEVEDKLVLIDTPGLYGFKEQFNSDTQEVEKYKDITRNYVSEAHLVLYVMNSTNPIKESHKEELQWLFRNLGLLPRTVFVLSRFDEVADVEEDGDYLEKFLVKKQNVAQRLDHMLQLSDAEKSALAIVAVAANPFGLGTRHWLDNMDQFRRLSHIADLQSATRQMILHSGGADALAEDVKRSIIADVIEKQLPIAKRDFQQLQSEASKLEDVHRDQQHELQKVNGEIKDARVRLRGKIVRYFEDLVLQAKGTTQETFAAFFQREIGSEGILIDQRVQEFFAEEVNHVALDIGRIQVKVDSEVSHFNNMVSAMSREGITYVTRNNLINNKSVLAARDGLNTAAKALGLDIGKYLKFKPWGATNLAKGLAGALAALGLALDVWDTVKQEQRKLDFQKDLIDMAEKLVDQRKEIVALIDGDDFEARFFPSFGSLQAQLQGIRDELDHLVRKQSDFRKWYQFGKAIDVEFREAGELATADEAG
ncbi:LeoA/HP0731 family dynamin-like GTPase [Variovorax ginsengisoli]|uniref:50S ribosome-binding GTPase n=1 Tax=Variovorax ginsengisoli TaxID=363844 RepID=A0ABT8SG47_9BURK|nr:LeoA/HP0731 family dynamin-like GTPase [Variovorax ginsengisoli]MDN8617281.1 50S ribosome-binding GTPase [Variovorax ginsengisoli]MDO1536451.1 50S ribosome-binding GTPase [Variovorax ginsengisoli]